MATQTIIYMYIVIQMVYTESTENCTIKDVFHNKLLYGHNDQILADTTLEACKQACMEDALCASFEYSDGFHKCYIAHADRMTNPGAYIDSNNFNYYEKHCPGWSVLPVEGVCNFKGYQRMALEVHDGQVIPHTNRYICQLACLEDQLCLSFDFDPENKRCLISHASKVTNPEAFIGNRSYNYYHKICPGDGEDWRCSPYEFKEQCTIRHVVENKLLHGHNEKTIRDSTLDVCTQTCMEDELCLSFDFSAKYRKCFIAHTDRMINPEAYSNSENYNYYEKWCPGYGFRPLKGGCNFVGYMNRALSGYNDQVIHDTNYYMCRETCRGDDLCLSFDFNHKEKKCMINHASKDTNPEALKDNRSYDYYHKDCPDKWEQEWLCESNF